MTNQITLPRDAEGREIPLNTDVLYSGNGFQNNIRGFLYRPKGTSIKDRWIVVFANGIERFAFQMHLTPPDSWEKLEEDLDMAVKKVLNGSCISPCCAWFNNGVRSCVDCPADESPTGTCNTQLINDIAARIRKLRGED